MKKLAIVFLVVAAVGCRRQAIVTSTPTSTPTAAAGSTTGAASAHDALRLFLVSVQTQDVQAMTSVWGSKEGSVRNTLPVDQYERRAIYMMRCLRHDSYTVQNETPAAGGDRVMMVQLRRGGLAPSGMFTMSQGPQGRWYVSNLDVAAFNTICSAK